MLTIKPISLKNANDYIINNHRHHDKVQGHKFSEACYEGDRLCGVACVGRPVSRYLDDGKTLEVTRLCTDGTRNACSILYSRCAKIAKEMGYEKIITYILQSEYGSSLKASGWILEEENAGGGELELSIKTKRTCGTTTIAIRHTEAKVSDREEETICESVEIRRTKMNIGLIDVDSHNYPNLALMKISAWHKAKGDNVEIASPFLKYDIVYQSRVFDDTYTEDIDYYPQADEIIKGGTGYGLTNTLPSEIENIMPDYSIFETDNTAYGFLTRGCPRHCKFCIVGDKEGLISHKVADIKNWWGGQKNIELLDPNILACKDREELLKQLIDTKAIVNFNQGLDIRFTDKDITELINDVKVSTIHFAWDNPNDDLVKCFDNFRKWHRNHNRRNTIVYVLTNFSSTHEEDLYRVKTLMELDYNPYIMIYNKPTAPKITKHLQRWCNNRFIFNSCSFEEYIKDKPTEDRDGRL